MPPAISDDESDGVDVPDTIPARAAPAIPESTVEDAKDEDDADVDGDDEDEDEDDDEDGEEYRVEKILQHEFDQDGTVLYRIKWLGYEKKADQTWEPIENLANAEELLRDYHDKIGGAPIYEPPAPKSSSKKNKGGSSTKRSVSAAFDSPAPNGSSKRKRKLNDDDEQDEKPSMRTLPNGSWESHVTRVSSIIEESAPASASKHGRKGTETRTLIGLLEWNDDNKAKTQHKLQVLRNKCPQKLLDYYEQHLRFETED